MQNERKQQPPNRADICVTMVKTVASVHADVTIQIRK